MFTVAIEIDTDDEKRIEDIIKGFKSITEMMAETTQILVWPGSHTNNKYPSLIKESTHG